MINVGPQSCIGKYQEGITIILIWKTESSHVFRMEFKNADNLIMKGFSVLSFMVNRLLGTYSISVIVSDVWQEDSGKKSFGVFAFLIYISVPSNILHSLSEMNFCLYLAHS